MPAKRKYFSNTFRMLRACSSTRRTTRQAKLLVSRRHAFFTKICVSPAGRVCVYSSLILSRFFSSFFQLQYSCIFHCKAVLDCCVGTVAGQLPGTVSTGDGSKACLEQAISRLQATPLSKKFEEIRNFNGGRYTMKRISKSMFRGAIAQPTSFKLCRMVQTYMLGMEPQAMMP